MIFSLDVRRARKGDCLLLHYGTKNDPGLVLIDGGPSKVYKPFLKPRLTTIRQKRNIPPQDALPVNLLMVSHIDDDHIKGILELTTELVEATKELKPISVDIQGLWHNSFDKIIGNSPKELLASVTASFGAAALSDEPDADGIAPETAMVLASVAQGFQLRDDAKVLELDVNDAVGGKLLLATAKSKALDMDKGLTFTIAGPMQAEVKKLQEEHDKFLKAKKKAKKKPTSALAAFSDESVANLSSIVVLAKVGQKSMLLTGDARGDKILQGLELTGLVKKGGKLHVDILKGPHHGSDRNVEPVFFRRITADHYVFSGNGEHGNPERETLQMVLDERAEDSYKVHLTYPIDEIDVGRKADWEKEQAKEKAKKKKKPATKVRPNWNPKKHSLAALLEDNPAFADKVVIVSDTDPHVIDLLDKLGF